MATVRLTNSMRDSIITDVMASAYKQEKEANKAAKHELALKAYDVIVPKKLQEALTSFPTGFCYASSCFSIYMTINEHGSERRFNFSMDDDKPLPESCRYGQFRLEKRNDKLIKEYDALQERDNQISKMYSELKNKLTEVLYAATTVTRLIEMWPEATEYIPESWLSPKSAMMLPAVVVDGLNNLLSKAIQPELKKAA